MGQVLYTFVASGQESVVNAFKSISAAAATSARAVAGSYASNARAAQQSANQSVTAQRRGASELEKLAQRVAKDQENAAKRAATAAQRESKRTADASIRDAKRAADEQIRESKRIAREAEKDREHTFQIRARYAANEAKAEARAAQAKARSRDRQISSLAGEAGSMALKGVAGLGLAAAATVGAAAREGAQLRDTTTRLSIGSRAAGQAFINPEDLAREFENIAIKTPGQNAQGIAEGAAQFVAKTGDVGAARSFSETFATTASATGSDVKDIADAAADLFDKFDIKTIDGMRDALTALNFQGKKGAFELKDAASQYAKLASAAQRFGLDKGANGVKTLGGLTQIARSATGSPEQAATALEATFRQLIAKSSVLKANGVNVFDKKGNARDIKDVLAETISKVGGNDVAAKKVGLQKIFGDEGIRAISPLINAYSDGAKGSTAAAQGANGKQAVLDRLNDAINAAGTWGDVVEDAAMAQKSSSAQLTVAWETLKAMAADKLVPAFAPLIETIPLLVNAFEPVIGVLGVFVEALVGLVNFLKSKGLITEKEKSHAELAKDAQEKLDRVHARLAAGGNSEFSHSDADLIKAGISPDAYKGLRQTVRDENAKAFVKPTKLNWMEFRNQYAAAGDASEDETDRLTTAAELSGDIQADPLASRTHMQRWGALKGETRDQRELREQYTDQIASEKQQSDYAIKNPDVVHTDDATGALARNLADVNTGLAALAVTLKKTPAGATASIAPNP
jgi:hypothetical protein